MTETFTATEESAEARLAHGALSALINHFRGGAAIMKTTLRPGTDQEYTYVQQGTIVHALADEGPYPTGMAKIRSVQVTDSTLSVNGENPKNKGQNVWPLPTVAIATENNPTSATLTWQNQREGGPVEATYQLTLHHPDAAAPTA